jgi:hypothetical protein
MPDPCLLFSLVILTARRSCLRDLLREIHAEVELKLKSFLFDCLATSIEASQTVFRLCVTHYYPMLPATATHHVTLTVQEHMPDGGHALPQ